MTLQEAASAIESIRAEIQALSSGRSASPADWGGVLERAERINRLLRHVIACLPDRAQL
jgi:hypothetical protein